MHIQIAVICNQYQPCITCSWTAVLERLCHMYNFKVMDVRVSTH